MGLENEQSMKKYVNINYGAFVIRVDENTDGAKPRKITKGKNTGKEIWEKHYGALSGYLVDMEVNLSDYGKQINITISDNDDIYILNIPWGNYSIRNKFLKILPNIDEKKPVKMHVWLGESQKGSDYRPTEFIIKQDDKVLKQAFTKEKPNGLPEAKEVEVAGEIKWDNTAVDNFLYAVFEKEKMRFRANMVREELSVDERQSSFLNKDPDLGLQQAQRTDDDVPF